MNIKFQSILVALVMSAVVLSGCTDSTEDAQTDGEAIDLTKGTLSGLLVDDNFRPVQLKENWGGEVPGDFQDDGFILIQETGDRIETNENGEFEVTGMPPGKYTLRLAALGHEALEHKVSVEAGETSSVTVESRRKATDSNTIITREYAIFIPCNLYATFDCTADTSGDSFRSGIGDNFTEYADDVTFAVWELSLNNPYIFCLEIRERSGGTGASLDRHFGNWCEGQDSTYTKGILLKDEVYDEKHSQDAWDPTAETDGILFTFGNNEATCWQKPGAPEVPGALENTDGRYRCAGLSMAVKAQIIVSLFLYDEEASEIEDYCVICSNED
jgi:hypothetical protein